MADVEKLIAHAEALLTRIEALLPAFNAGADVRRASQAGAPQNAGIAVDWKASNAFRWRVHHTQPGARGFLEPVKHVHKIALDDLLGIDRQKELIEQNTRQFIAGLPANSVLMTGARGTGKSSMVKALLNKYTSQGLRVIEVEKRDLPDLPDIVELIANRPERFIIYCDDLSFEAEEPGYKALKVILDGSVSTTSDNCLVYATSNRRHLMPEYMSENLETHRVGDEIHPGETVEEKISLSERFGLWVSFYPFDQDEFLNIVAQWLQRLGAKIEDETAMRREALQWALARGSRSGRVAWQFARDYAGRTKLSDR